MAVLLNDERLSGHWHAALPPSWLEAWPDYASFTPWLPIRKPFHAVTWREGDAHGSDDIGSFCGVYLVARFDAPPSGSADPFDPAVDYIGRTRTGSLRARWGQFRAAALGNGGHSGGNTFCADFCTKIVLGDAPAELDRTYVAGLPVWFPASAQPETSFRTAMIEAVLVDAVHHHRAKNQMGKLLNKA